jgi:hypothetical protein
MLPTIPIIGWAGAAVATATLSHFVKQHLKTLNELETHKINEELRIKATNEIANISNNIGKAQGIMKFIEDNENELDKNTKEKLWKEYINILDKKSDLLIK